MNRRPPESSVPRRLLCLLCGSSQVLPLFRSHFTLSAFFSSISAYRYNVSLLPCPCPPASVDPKARNALSISLTHTALVPLTFQFRRITWLFLSVTFCGNPLRCGGRNTQNPRRTSGEQHKLIASKVRGFLACTESDRTIFDTFRIYSMLSTQIRRVWDCRMQKRARNRVSK